MFIQRVQFFEFKLPCLTGILVMPGESNTYRKMPVHLLYSS